MGLVTSLMSSPTTINRLERIATRRLLSAWELYRGFGSSGLSVDLGFEPQFVLVKSISLSNTSWIIFDMMRSMSESQQVQIQPNTTSSELTDNSSHGLYATATGFASTTANNFFNNGSGTHTYAYMAIRRPHKPPTAATEVFDVQASSNDSGGTSTSSSVTADFTISAFRNLSGVDKWVATRLLRQR